MKVKVFTDGGARGNPGPAACAFVVYEGETGAEILREKRGKYIGETTNNVAEYSGVIEALSWVKEQMEVKGEEEISEVDFFLDSDLVVNQLNGLFKVKDAKLREMLVKVRSLEQALSPVLISYSYVPREQNAQADRLVNETLDGRNQDDR